MNIDDVMWSLLLLTALAAFYVVGGAVTDLLAGRRERKWWER